MQRPLIDHRVIEIFKLESKNIWNCKAMIPKVEKLIKHLNLKVLSKKYYDFKPQGATLLFILSSSHLAVHTWPENNYLHIDLVTCVPIVENKKILEVLKEVFGVKKNQIKIRKVKYEN